MTREELEKKYPIVLDTQELQEKYIVQRFSAGYVEVKNKETQETGSFDFTIDYPRFYYDFRAHPNKD